MFHLHLFHRMSTARGYKNLEEIGGNFVRCPLKIRSPRRYAPSPGHAEGSQAGVERIETTSHDGPIRAAMIRTLRQRAALLGRAEGSQTCGERFENASHDGPTRASMAPTDGSPISQQPTTLRSVRSEPKILHQSIPRSPKTNPPCPLWNYREAE